jgi:hypothetical protein
METSQTHDYGVAKGGPLGKLKGNLLRAAREPVLLSGELA